MRILLTISNSVEDASKEPFSLLAEELGVCICSTGSSRLPFTFRDSENILPVFVSEGNMDMSTVFTM
jgi:hypothetical protein